MTRADEVLATLRRILAGHRVTVLGQAPDGFAAGFGFGSEGPPVTVLARRGPDEPGPAADVVIDWSRPDWPVIRHVDPRLPWTDADRLGETRAFFAVRAAGWDSKFRDDLPGYEAAVRETGIGPDAVAADVGCGTGRALPFLRAAAARVLAIDATAEMLDAVGRTAGTPGSTCCSATPSGCRWPMRAWTSCSPPGCCRAAATRPGCCANWPG